MGVSLATCSFQEFHPSMGAPIRTTVGAPRYPLGYDLAGHWLAVTPIRSFLGQPEAIYRDLYRRMLDQVGIKRLVRETHDLAAKAGSERLVLLCFDRLAKADGWCHRTMLAEWWLERTGEVVPELGDVHDPASEPPTLF